LFQITTQEKTIFPLCMRRKGDKSKIKGRGCGRCHVCSAKPVNKSMKKLKGHKKNIWRHKDEGADEIAIWRHWEDGDSYV
jgi:hypothetical protein